MGPRSSTLRLESRSRARAFVDDVSNMNNGQNAAGERIGGSKPFSVHIKVKAQSSTDCSFCWFVLALYPTLKGMTEKDTATFKAHLKQSHGLKGDIQQ